MSKEDSPVKPKCDIVLNSEEKTYSLEFNESPNIHPEKHFDLKKKLKYPIVSVSRNNIIYRTEDDGDTLVIEGKENCQERINVTFMTLLSAFPFVYFEQIEVYKPEISPKPFLVTYRYVKDEIDHIKKIVIKGYIKDLTADEKEEYESPFNAIIFERPEGEPDMPFKFTCLETIDLSECIGLEKFNWFFLLNPHLKNIIFPQHPIKYFGTNWTISLQIDRQVQGDVLNVVNSEYAEDGEARSSKCCFLI